MAGIRVEGNTSGNVAEVTSTNELKVTLPEVIAQAGYAVMFTENDDGTYNTGAVAQRRSPNVSNDSRLSVGLDTPVFDSAFNSTTQDTGVWRCMFTTMTITQSGGFAFFNANNTTTATTGASLQTWRHFSMVNNNGLSLAFIAASTIAIPANQVAEMGWFLGTAPTAGPTDGVYFRVTSAGIIGVVNYNGVETPTAALDSTFLVPGELAKYQIRIYTDSVDFWVNNRLLGKVTIPVGNPQVTLTCTLPATFQMRNSGAVVSPTQWKLGHVSVDQRDVASGMLLEAIQSGMGLNGSNSTSGNTMGGTAGMTNNQAAGAGAVMTNTTAAIGTGLGGQFSVQPTLAAGTDGILCSYQVPQGTVNIRPRTLMIRGVKIHGVVTTVLAGNATPLIYAFTLAFGHTAVSAATTEGASFSTATTKIPRRIALGFESYAAAAALGTLGSTGGVYMPFAAPVCVNPGEFVAVLAKNLGVVTTSGVVTFYVSFDSYWI
jgi:hypothetical protein